MSGCRIVLVRTHYAGNLGASARVMHNFGLRDLVLVDPQCDLHDREARRLSTQGEFILDRARIVRTLAEAVGDCTHVAATSALTGGLFRGTTERTLREAMPKFVEAAAGGQAALVFGPEPSGLTNEEIGRCHDLITIPTAPEYPALNLAQAVAISLYEFHLAVQSCVAGPSPKDAPAGFAEQERMFDHLRKALEDVHFLYGPKADALMHALRHLLGRAEPSPIEVRLLHGLARQLEWVARSGDESGARSVSEGNDSSLADASGSAGDTLP
jgi:tRNA/rRNA methyltransferase